MSLRHARFAGVLLTAMDDPRVDPKTLLAAIRWFLRNRLTEAAIAGCHQCDEGEKGTPCWWCGLKKGIIYLTPLAI